MTGATGFIGSYVAFELLGAGHDLVVVARNPEKLPALSAHPRVRRVTATLAQRELMRDALAGCEACVHVALGWGDSPVDMLLNDTLPSIALLEDCAAVGIQRFLYTSSTAALGPFFANMSEADPTRPNDYYGATKAATEAYVFAAGAKSGMACNVIRPGYTFGNPSIEGAPTQPDRRFHAIASAARRGEPIQLRRGDGTQFVWAGDLARLYRAVLESDRSREVYYGLGTAFVSWERVAEISKALCQSSSPIILEGEATAPCLFDLGKIERDFGFVFEAESRLREHVAHLLQSI
jgi:UDP-glucose 4-epimerase